MVSDPTPRRPSPRRRILNAALELAVEGGYDAMQVRTLAQRAKVSSRTIYMHFDSLDSLLVVAIAELSQPLYRQYTESPPRTGTAIERISQLFSELTQTMTANRGLTMALLRSLLSGKPDIVPFIRGYREVLEEVLAKTIADDEPTPEDRLTSEILQCVWFSALIGWATGTEEDSHVIEIMQSTAERLLTPASTSEGPAVRAGR